MSDGRAARARPDPVSDMLWNRSGANRGDPRLIPGPGQVRSRSLDSLFRPLRHVRSRHLRARRGGVTGGRPMTACAFVHQRVRVRTYGSCLARVLMFVCVAMVGSAASGGHWEMRAPMPSKRSEVAVAKLDGKIYVIGGLKTLICRSLGG